MGAPKKYKAGKKFGLFTIVEYISPGLVSAQCACGKIGTFRTARFLKYATCGCLENPQIRRKKERHGERKSPTYTSWAAMKSRCYRKGNNRYYAYGARGIVVCERWKESFSNFLADMGPRPPGTTLDRIDSDGNYEPSNCKWSTIAEQNKNRRRGWCWGKNSLS